LIAKYYNNLSDITVKILLLITFAFSLFSCITIKIAKTEKSEIPKSDSSIKGTKIMDLVSGMINMGLGEKISDFANMNFGFTVVDANLNFIPYSNIVLDFGATGKIKIGSANDKGQFSLVFTKESLLLNPSIFGEKSGKLFGVSFRATATIDENEKIQNVNLQSLKSIEVKPDILFYSETAVQSIIDNGISVLRLQRNTINEFTNTFPIEWGMALIDKKSSFVLSPPTYYLNNKTVTVFPFSLKEEFADISRSNLHEWTEQTLKISFNDRLPRWFADGASEAIGLIFYRKLSNTDRYKYGFTKEYLKGFISKARLFLIEFSKENKTYDLYDWNYFNEKDNFKDKNQQIGYAVSASFIYGLIEKHGDDIISKILNRIDDNSKITNDYLINILKTITGIDYANILKNYSLSEVAIFYDRLESEFQK